MFGILFEGHKDLRRILNDYGFLGHPLRKDYPLSGYEEIYYSNLEKRLTYAKITLSQEYRNFNFQNP